MTNTKKIPGVPEGMQWERKDRLYYLTTKEQPLVFLFTEQTHSKKTIIMV